MAREKATITLDKSKAERARSLLGAASTSESVDIALDFLIRSERLRRDIVAYRRVLPTDAELEGALLSDVSALADDTDWETLYLENVE